MYCRCMSVRDNAARDLGVRGTYPFGFLISLRATRHSRTHPPRRLRARICRYTCVDARVCGRTGSIGRRRRVNLIVGFWVSASRRVTGFASTTARGMARKHRIQRGENDGGGRTRETKLEARGCPIRRRAFRRQSPATPTRYTRQRHSATAVSPLEESAVRIRPDVTRVTRCCCRRYYVPCN